MLSPAVSPSSIIVPPESTVKSPPSDIVEPSIVISSTTNEPPVIAPVTPSVPEAVVLQEYLP
jgi:hypothetical protein